MKFGGRFARFALVGLLTASMASTGVLPAHAAMIVMAPMNGAESDSAPTEDPAPDPEPTADPAPSPDPEPTPAPEPAPAPSPCEILINAYTSGGGSLSPEALRNQGGLGADIAACLGIDLGPAPATAPTPGTDSRPSCDQIIELVHRQQGPNPSVEWLASQGGLGTDYANCRGIDLSRPSTATGQGSEPAKSPGTQVGSTVESTTAPTTDSGSPAQVIFSQPGVDVRSLVVAPNQTRVALGTPLKQGSTLTVKVLRRDPKTGKSAVIGQQKTQVKAKGTVRARIKERLRDGDVIVMTSGGKRVAAVRLTDSAQQAA